jgi:signal transduction histidine kinase
MTAVDSTATDRPTTTTREQWFAGLTLKGVAIVLGLCAINAIRRTLTMSELWNEPLQWLIRVASTFVSSLLVAICIVAAVLAAYNRLPSRGWRLYAGLGAAVTLASALGAVLLVGWETGGTFGYESDWMDIMREWRSVFVQWPRYLVFGLLLAGIYVYVRQRQESATAMRQLELDRSGLEQRLTEARLQMLQAQIEPHFLFNTLANVRRLYQIDPVAGGDMLDNLMRYLAVALPQMRDANSTLGREAALAEAYLNIHRIRMGPRLAFSLDVPATLHGVSVPPMLLVPLAENAIKHGLNPLPQGGSVRISACDENGRLVVSVADTGQGFVRTAGGGTGLANLRARLAGLYGTEAALSMAHNAPQGVIATVVLPRVDADAHRVAA